MPSTTVSPISATGETHVNNKTKNRRPSFILSTPLETLTNIDEVREALRLLDEEETCIDSSLDNILAEEQALNKSLSILSTVRTQLDSLKIDSVSVIDTVEKTSCLAEDISFKVRQLEQEQSRVKEAIQYVEDVQDLKYCISNLQTAIQKKDYDHSAELLNKALKIDSAIVHGSLAEFTVPSSDYPDHPAKTLSDAKSKLFDIFSQRFDDAVAQRNQSEITRYFKLFPLIDCQTEGLDKYSRFVCNIIKARCADELESGLVAAPTYFADALTRLFENIAVIIDKHQPLVETNYGNGKMLRVIQRLQEESDMQSNIILDRFIQTRQLESKLVEIQSLMITMMRTHTHQNGYKMNTGVMAPTKQTETIDPRQLDQNIYELSLISQRSILFNSFMNERATDEMVILATDEKDMVMKGKDRKLYGQNGLLIQSGLTRRVKELMNSYLVIEEYILKQSINKAMRLDSYDPSLSPTSTCVDDVYYILKTVVKRIISTYDPDVILSTIKTIIRVLETTYLQQFQQKMATLFTGYDLSGRDRSMEQAKINYMVILNNLDVSVDYTHRLVKEVEPDIIKGIWLDEDNDIKKTSMAMKELEGMADKFKQLLKNGLDQLMNQIIRPRIRPLFQDAYKEVKYVLEEEEYNEANIDEKFVKRFRMGLAQLTGGYKKTLNENNFATLIELVTDAIILQWERIVMQTRFNQYGALRFDKDLRTVIYSISSMTQWLSRDRFTRLNQMSTVLNLDEPSEIQELWGNKATIGWRLTIPEVKKMLGLRLDFDTEEVAQLALKN